MEKHKGLINEIVKQNLSPHEMKEKLGEKGISEKPYHIHWITSLSVSCIIWLLPGIAKYSGWGFLRFFANLHSMKFPLSIVIIGLLFIIVGISLISQASYRRKELGGLQDVDETIYIIKEGLYRVVRHPDFLGQLFLFPAIPLVLSRWIPFTILGVIYWIMIIGSIALFVLKEEKFNLKKWGKQYRDYQREVSSINFVKGLWNLRKAKP